MSTTHSIDQDDLNRTLDRLAIHHGSLEVSKPNLTTGSVTIYAESGSVFRFTTQSRLIALPKGTRR